MVNDEDKLLPRIGKIEAARTALEFVGLSCSQTPAPDDDEGQVDDQSDDLIVALSNLSALLLRMMQVSAKRQNSTLDVDRLLGVIAEAQEVHAARDELEQGFPFDA